MDNWRVSARKTYEMICIKLRRVAVPSYERVEELFRRKSKNGIT